MRHSLKYFYSLIFIILFSSSTYAQPNGKGLDFDDEEYLSVPQKAKLTRSLDQLPSSATLKNYCPKPKTQGSHGTCAAWATAYCASTIMEAKKRGWTNKEEITNNAYSPAYLFRLLKPADANCVGGASLVSALQLMKDQGSVLYKQVSQACIPAISQIAAGTSTNKIEGFMRIFGSEASREAKIFAVKKSLAEKKPVVIGMATPPSFDFAKNVWKPTEQPNRNFGGHALCVIGYDDNIDGGSFEVQNSWGTAWGNQGYMWINYATFAAFTNYAFEVVDLPDSKPDVVDLSGEIKLVLANAQEMPAKLFVSTRGLVVVPSKTVAAGSGPLTLYRTASSYVSGTRFRIYISNNEPAFVYALSSDLTNEVTKIFPYEDGVSAALTDRKNNVAIPDEDHFIEFDNKPGKDFLCVLYSKAELNINEIIERVKRETGSFSERIFKVLDDKIVEPKNIQFSSNNISFKGYSRGKTIIPLMVEMEHK